MLHGKAEEILWGAARRQGWAEGTQREILCHFIDRLAAAYPDVHTRLRAYLDGLAAAENDEAEGVA